MALLRLIYLATLVSCTNRNRHNDSKICNIAVLDENGAEYHLLAIANKVAATLSPTPLGNSWHSLLHWTASRWFYDPPTEKLMTFTDIELCLEADSNSFKLSLANGSSGVQNNQRFVYNQEQRELFWLNPKTNHPHPIYLEKDALQIVKGNTPFTSRRPFISRNPISKWIADEIRLFAANNASKQITLKPRNYGFRLRALTLHSLRKAMPNFSSSEYQKYMKMIEALTERKFGYFATKQNRFLLSDGYTVTALSWRKFKGVNFKYYGLWHVDEKGHLMHFLSGKCLQAISNYISRNIKILERMLHPAPIIMPSNEDFHSSKMNDTFYDLKLAEYSSIRNSLFITTERVRERNEMYIHNMGFPQRIVKSLIATGADAFLAFVSNETYDKIWKAITDEAEQKNQGTSNKGKIKVRTKLKRCRGFSVRF